MKTRLTRLLRKQEDPKSTTRMAERLGLQRRMFSGLRSQWMMPRSGRDKKASAVHNCCANFRVKFNDTPGGGGCGGLEE